MRVDVRGVAVRGAARYLRVVVTDDDRMAAMWLPSTAGLSARIWARWRPRVLAALEEAGIDAAAAAHVLAALQDAAP